VDTTPPPPPPPPPSEKEEVCAENASAGSTVTTDTENDGATGSDPVETSDTTPVAGKVCITETTITDQSPAGYSLIGQQIDITSPTATPENPIKLVFLLDRSRVPQGEDQNTVQIFRNGTQVQNCTGAAGVASPNPCVSERSLNSEGNLRFTVLTSAASRWTFRVPMHTPGPQPSPPPSPQPPPPPGTNPPSPTPIGGGPSKGHKSKQHHKKQGHKGHGKHKHGSGLAIRQ
jgi:hypothetical protein